MIDRPNQLSLLMAGSCAAILAVVSLAMGFGWLSTIPSALAGGVAGHWAARRYLTDHDGTSDFPGVATVTKGILRGGVASYRSDPPENTSIVSVVLKPILALPTLKRWASMLFLVQAATSAIIILIFWLVHLAGFDVRILSEPAPVVLFKTAFPIDEHALVAKAWFDNVFVPLALLYVVSLSVFGIAMLGSVGALARQLRSSALLLSGIVFFLVSLFLLFFVGDSAGSRGLQRYIVEGNAWGYVVLFVFLPIFGVFLAAELPQER